MRLARRDLAEIISAFEYMDHEALRVVERELNLQLPSLENFIESNKVDNRHAIFIEISSSMSVIQAEDLVNTFINKLHNLGLCKSSTISQNKDDIEKLWRARKAVIDACKLAGLVYKFDLKVSAGQLPELIRLLESISANEKLLTFADGTIQRAPDGPDNEARVKDIIIFGQLPTGNIHVVAVVDSNEQNLLTEMGAHDMPDCVKRLQAILWRWLSLKSSSSGILSLSKEYNGKWIQWAHRVGANRSSPEDLPGRSLQIALKRAWDPNGIMNPYKLWPLTKF